MIEAPVRHRAGYVLICGLVFLCIGAGGLRAQEFSWVADLKRATISVTPNGEALVEESRPLDLRPGVNRVRFSWAGVQLEPGSVRLRLPRSDAHHLVESRSYRNEKARVWVIQSSRETRVNAAVSYVPRGVRRWDEYRVELSAEGTTFDLVQRVLLTNQSGRAFERVWIGLGNGYWVPRPWPDGQTKKLSTYRVHDVPFERIYRYESGPHTASGESRTGPRVTYQFANSNSFFLGDIPLPGGTVRMFESSPGGDRVFVGEDRLSYREVGDSVVLELGRTEDLTVDRQKTLRERFNVRRDRAGNRELYDRRVVLEYRVQNFRSETSLIHLRERIPGEWELVDSSHDSRQPDHQTLLVPIRLEPGESVRVRVEYIQRHLQP